MFEGSPEHDFFSQPQLKFPMFVFSFTMFSVKENFWGGDAARDRTHVSDKKDSLRLCWSSSTWWTLVQVTSAATDFGEGVCLHLCEDCGVPVSNSVVFALQVGKRKTSKKAP